MSEQTTYTDSAKIDHITDVLNSKKYTKLIYSLRGNAKTIFRFNPLDDEKVTDIYLQEPEVFPFLVKKAIIDIIARDDKDLEKSQSE